MSDRDEFFIGYAPPMPSGVGRFVGRIVTGLVLGVLAGAAIIALGHVTLEGGTFEFRNPQRFAGTIVERPYPALRLDGSDRGIAAPLLVGPGKHGADEVIRGLGGRHVSLTGAGIRRGMLTMIEIEPASVKLEQRSMSDFGGAPDAEPVGTDVVTVTGEVVDSKCFLGVMVPGSGKTHKDCASLCLRGGVPPALFVRDQAGESALMLLTGVSGQAIGAHAIQIAGEAVEMTGMLERRDGWLVLHTDPSVWHTVTGRSAHDE
jgi:hypothetical protein